MNYSRKLQRLHDRRHGLYSSDGVYNLAEALAADTAFQKKDKYESISEPESVKYAIGSMQRVDDDYTRNSYAEGNRVRDRLSEGLAAANIPATFEYQGSVPLDVHVRGNSDVDLLVLHNGFVTVDQAANQQYHYSDYQGKSPKEELKDLRKESISILERRYYGAKVNTSGSKSISLSGGSLKRKVDVVPSHWHDTLAWKQTNDTRHREIYVLDSHADVRINNRPFMHIKTVEEKCIMVKGSLRKVIRLLKNLRYDAEQSIDLSSYDITAIAWHMTEQELSVSFGMDLLLVEQARQHLRYIIDNENYRNKLKVPDGSRLIYDKADKLIATIELYKEIDKLAQDIYKELVPYGYYTRTYPQVLAKAIYL
jgi:hypothetical protein